jgi:hypothetical protein
MGCAGSDDSGAEPKPQPAELGLTPPGLALEEYVATPAGLFHPSCVVEVAAGEKVGAGGVILQANGATRRMPPCPFPHYDRFGRAIGAEAVTTPVSDTSTWVVSSQVSSRPAFNFISANWTVPSAPSVQDDQTIYYFPGVDQANGGGLIAQPVLGWHKGWTIASWVCCVDGIINHSALIPVNPGDALRGYASGSNCGGDGVCTDWLVETIDTTSGRKTLFENLGVSQVFDGAVGGALETYRVYSCGHYPAGSVPFTNIFTSRIDGTLLRFNWPGEAPPSTFSPWCDYSLTGGNDVTITVNPEVWALDVHGNADGRLELLLAEGHAIVHDWQTTPGGGWNGTVRLGGAAKQVAVAIDEDPDLNDTRLEIVYVGTNDALYHNWQTAPGGSWHGEDALGGFAKQVAIGQNADGRLEVFYVGTNDALYHNWQTAPSGGWHGEQALGGLAKRVAVARNLDGRLEVFYVGTNRALYHNWQTSKGGAWFGERPLGGLAREIAVADNYDGRLEVFYVGTNNALYHNWQTSVGGGWNGEEAMGGLAQRLAVNRNDNWRLELFYIGTDNALYHNWQTIPGGGWSGQAALGGSAKAITVGRNRDDRLELFYIGTSNVLYHNWQITTGGAWSGENVLP